jgi:hypothetical protein
MVDTFTPKRIFIDGKAIAYAPNTLVINSGHGETSTRTQVSGRSVIVVPSENLETQVAEIAFDMLTVDSDSDSDPRVLIKDWKSRIGSIQILVEPDGPGQKQLFKNASLMNSPSVAESSDGVISLTWNSSKAILTN